VTNIGDGRRNSSNSGGHASWVHVFVYGTLRSGHSANAMLDGCQHVGEGSVGGVLYDLDDYPALMLYGSEPVRGEVWCCPPELIGRLDEYEGVERGLFRRVAVAVGEFACWTWVAGPAIARRLTPERRLDQGDWRPRRPA